MASQGGVLATVGITPSFLTQLATQTASSGVSQALGQVWQGAGQSFFGSAGQALGGALAGSAINIALNSALGTDVVGPQGLSLTSGANILASTITPYVTGALAAGINQNINNSLKSAGPFGPILSNLGTSLVNQAFGGIANAITGGTTSGLGNATNYKMFPGGNGEGEAPADYGGSSYTLDDVVFSLQPANQGPQAFGESQAANEPKTPTTTTAREVAGNAGNMSTGAESASNAVKFDAMATGVVSKPDYAKSLITFLREGTPTTEAEILELDDAGIEALNDALNATIDKTPFPQKEREIPPGSWTFITAPEDVSWDVANAANRVDMFGTNNPPVVAGSRGMRDLTLGNALVEGFVRGVSLEGKIATLENLMNYSLNTSDGFVSVPVYQVWVSAKPYGGAQGYFIIKDVKVKETMRDLKGYTTRAYVDISLMQVPAYQVNSGRDQASKVTAGAEAGLIKASNLRAAQRVDGNGQSNLNNPANRRGVNVPQSGSSTKPKDKPKDTRYQGEEDLAPVDIGQ
jgi:hypothetical protein